MDNTKVFYLIMICLFGLLIFLFSYQIKQQNKCNNLGGVYIDAKCFKAKIINLEKD